MGKSKKADPGPELVTPEPMEEGRLLTNGTRYAYNSGDTRFMLNNWPPVKGKKTQIVPGPVALQDAEWVYEGDPILILQFHQFERTQYAARLREILANVTEQIDAIVYALDLIDPEEKAAQE